MLEHTEKISKLNFDFLQLPDVLNALKGRLDKLELGLTQANIIKTDLAYTEQRHAEVQQQLTLLQNQIDRATHDSTMACNYMYRFAPIYTQRQLTQTLFHVFPQKDIRWRINWFNEVKMPLLNAYIMSDNKAEHLLSDKIAAIKKLVKENPVTQMNVEQHAELLPDEKFL